MEELKCSVCGKELIYDSFDYEETKGAVVRYFTCSDFKCNGRYRKFGSVDLGEFDFKNMGINYTDYIQEDAVYLTHICNLVNKVILKVTEGNELEELSKFIEDGNGSTFADIFKKIVNDIE